MSELLRTLYIANDNDRYNNLELGAGPGKFGELFYPECYLTDNNSKFINEIHHVCSATKIPWPADRFENVIMANPFKYGFNDVDQAAEILSEVGRILKNSGKLIVIGGKTNKYVNKLSRYIKSPFSNGGISFTFEEQKIISTTEYPNHIFRHETGDETVPTLRYIGNVSK